MRATCATALLVVTVAGTGTGADADAPPAAIFATIVNETATGEFTVLVDGDDVLVRVVDLQQAGLREFSGRRHAADGHAYVSLRSLEPDVHYTVDERTLTLRLQVDPRLLARTVVDLHAARPARFEQRTDPSAFVNYAFNLADFSRFSAFAELGARTGDVLVFNSLSLNSSGEVVRGLSTLTIDDRPRLARWTIGEAFNAPALLGGTGLFGGVTFARDFGLDPYLVRFPMYRLTGTAATPATAELFVNERLVRRESLPAGAFELANVPVPPGSGTSRLVIRDMFGREQVATSAFYFTTGVLAPGLHDYSYTIGVQRRKLGVASAAYDDEPTALGRHRVGITDWITAGGRAEVSPRLASGGGSITTRTPFGEAELALAGSLTRGEPGGAASVGYSFFNQRFGLGGGAKLLTDRYATVSLAPAADRPRLETSGFLSVQAGPRVGVSLGHAHADNRDAGRTDRTSLALNVRLTDRANLFVNASHTSTRMDTPSWEAFTGVSVFLGERTTASLSYGQRNAVGSASVDLQRSLPLGTGLGGRLHATEDTGGRARGLGILEYQGRHGRYEVSYENTNGDGHATMLRAAGALVALGGDIYATRPVQDSFGLIQVPGVLGVKGYVNNQEIGETDRHGNLPIPNLLPNYGNRVAIGTDGIPMDYTVGAVERVVGPGARGGAVIAFPVERLQAIVGRLQVDTSLGLLTPLYGDITITAGGQVFVSPIGRDGDFYLENVPAGRHPAVVEHPSAPCRFTLEIPQSSDTLLDLGTLRCPADQPATAAR